MNYKVYAIEYATRAAARSSENFFGHQDPHEDAPMPLSYYIWLAVSAENTVVIDIGFTEEVAVKRGREFLRCPIETLSKLDVEPDAVPYVVVTHMHYDHIGNAHKLPKARFFLQESEMSFWTGKYASKGNFKGLVEVDDVVHLVRENFNGRIHFVDGNAEILPGISVYRTGGHSAGLQVVKIQTEGGNVILASDASHFYRNIDEDRPFSVVHNLADMYGAFETVRSLADESSVIVPGHDPLVMERFPAVPGLEGIAVCLG